MTAIENAIPPELRALAQWVVYRAEPNSEGKTTKRPYQPASTRTLASSTNGATWSSYDTAIAAVARDRSLHGVGFVFSINDPYMGIDLDHCIVDGVISAVAQRIIDLLDSYAEYSHSGDGVHVLVQAQLERGHKNRRIEMYSSGRYFTMSGRHIPGTPLTINPRQDQVDELVAEFFKDDHEEPVAPPRRPNTIADSELLSRAYQFRNGAAFRALYEQGDTAPYGGDDSGADLALCNHLAFATGNDPQRMDTLFRQSALYRKKWDERHGERTYGRMTIDKAIAATRETYSPPGATYRAEAGGFGRNGHGAEPDPETGEIPMLSGRVDLWDRIQNGTPDPDWLIRDVLLPGMVTMLHGEPGCGKTILALAFALNLVRQGFPVMFIDEESGTDLTAVRLSQMGITQEEAALIHYYPFAGITLADSAILINEVLRVEPAAVIFDSMADVLGASDLDENAATDVTRWMVTVAVAISRSEAHSSTVILDHNPKSQENVKYARGSGAKKAKCDVSWFVNKTAEFDAQTMGRVRLERTKNRPGFIPDEVTYEIGGMDGQLIVTRFNASEHFAHATNEHDAAVLEELKEAGEKGLTRRELERPKRGRSVMQEVLNRLVNDRLIEPRGASNMKRYVILTGAMDVSQTAGKNDDLSTPAVFPTGQIQTAARGTARQRPALPENATVPPPPIGGGSGSAPAGWQDPATFRPMRRYQNSEGEWE